MNVVGAGAYARDLAAVLGGGDKSTWLVNSLTIMTVVLSPPISEAADFWGRKWFLVGLTAMGCVSVIVSLFPSSEHLVCSFNLAMEGSDC